MLLIALLAGCTGQGHGDADAPATWVFRLADPAGDVEPHEDYPTTETVDIVSVIFREDESGLTFTIRVVGEAQGGRHRYACWLNPTAGEARGDTFDSWYHEATLDGSNATIHVSLDDLRDLVAAPVEIGCHATWAKIPSFGRVADFTETFVHDWRIIGGVGDAPPRMGPFFTPTEYARDDCCDVKKSDIHGSQEPASGTGIDLKSVSLWQDDPGLFVEVDFHEDHVDQGQMSMMIGSNEDEGIIDRDMRFDFESERAWIYDKEVEVVDTGPRHVRLHPTWQQLELPPDSAMIDVFVYVAINASESSSAPAKYHDSIPRDAWYRTG